MKKYFPLLMLCLLLKLSSGECLDSQVKEVNQVGWTRFDSGNVLGKELPN